MSSSPCHQFGSIEAKSIYGIMETLRALESADFPMHVDQMWSICFPVLCQGDAETKDMMGLLTGLKSALNELKDLLHTFKCLTESLERKISSVQTKYKSMALSHGMKTAPMEILNRIFEMAYCGDNRTTFNLSLVNKRFHDIVMHNPRLWNKTGNRSTGEVNHKQLQVCLKRSKNVGLDVQLDCRNYAAFPDVVDILGIAAPEASRWECVSYLMESWYDGNRLNLFRDISRHSTGLNLPRLQSATPRYPKLRSLSEDDPKSIIDQSEPLMHFYTTWYLPNLTNLTVYNLIPRPFLHLVPPLTTLTLDINEPVNYNVVLKRVYDMNLLLEFLRSSCLLETFRLRLVCFTPSTKDDNRTLPETVLPNLQTFEFTADHWIVQSLLPFTKALRFPCLRNLHVCVETNSEISGVGEDVWLDCVLPHSHEHYMNVEVFSYKTRTSSKIAGSGCHFPYDVPFSKLHNLRSLILGTPYLKPNIWRSCDDARTCTGLPKLKDIRFVRCDALGGLELRSFKELIEKQGKWDTLKKVAFKRCKSLSEDTVRSLFEGKDVTWEE